MSYDIKTKYNLQEILVAQNVCDLLTEEDCKSIGDCVVKEFDMDDETREQWKEKYQEAWKLALQVTEAKTSPWPGSSNVKFPLLTEACLQFQSRAYPALVTEPELVKCRAVGEDPDGSRNDRAERVSQFMSWQLLEEDEEWEADTDKMLLTLPITGCVIRKSYYDFVCEHNKSCMILPEDFVVSYYTKSLDECPRATHILHYSQREIENRQRLGIYCKVDQELGPGQQQEAVSNLEAERQQERGITEPEGDPDAPRVILEQHRFLDLDGDGYEEPYVVTVDHATHKVLRVFPRFTDTDIRRDNDSKTRQLASQTMQMMAAPLPQDPTQAQLVQKMRHEQAQDAEQEIQRLKAQGKVLYIDPVIYFTKYSFIPAPDGAFYDVGFGSLLAPINHAVDTIVNQLIDAGSLQNSNVGFLGASIRVRGGDYRFRPFEWKKTDAAPGALKENIVPLPINQPSEVLFKLLDMLINYAERLSSVTDVMVGETPGQNTPASVVNTTLDQGMKVFSGILKRLYRSMKQEFRKLYRLNRLYLDPQEYFTVLNSQNPGVVYQQDFLGDPRDISPEADPSVASESQRLQRIQFLIQRSSTTPGYDTTALEQRLLKEMHIPDAQEIYPPVPPQPSVEQQELQIKAADAQRKTMESHVDMMTAIAEADAKVINQMAQAQLFAAQAEATVGAAEAEKIKNNLQFFEALHGQLQGMMQMQQDQQHHEDEMELEQQQLAQQKQEAQQNAQSQGQSGTS